MPVDAGSCACTYDGTNDRLPPLPDTDRRPRRTRLRPLVELALPRAGRFPTPRLPAVAPDRPQPGADAPADRRASGWRPPPRTAAFLRAVRRRRPRPGHGAHRRTTRGGRSASARWPTAARIAYFSAEFALHQSLPIYAGGLGVLAGDICKEASDLGLPLVGVGFMYPQGYFHQHVSADGWQQEELRTARLGRCAHRAGAAARRHALRRRRAAGRPHGAGRRLAGPRRPRPPVPARHGPGGERALGPRAVGAPLRRQPGDAHPAGDRPGPRRRPRAARAGHRADGVAPQRGTRRLRRPAAHPRVSSSSGLRFDEALRGGAAHHGLHDAHAGAGRPRRVPVPPGRDAPGRRVGQPRRAAREVPGARRVRQRQRQRCST